MITTILFQAKVADVAKIKDSIQHLAVGAIQVLAPFSAGKPNVNTTEDPNTKRAKEIAEAIRPVGKQTMRLEALNAALGDYDSFLDQGGKADDGMRVALAALSKALRPFAPSHASPMDLIAVRERKYFDEGTYKGTVYRCTALGVLVRAELKKMQIL